MTAKEFFDLVAKMRIAQKDYFKARHIGLSDEECNIRLQYSKDLEKKVDYEIKRVQRLEQEPEFNFQ